MSRPSLVFSLLIGLSFGANLSCSGGGTAATCRDGAEGCPCDAGACDDGLSCLSAVCVATPSPTCGNAVLEGDEECDNGARNGDDRPCKSDCTLQFCGDGLVGPGELCDDGNTSNLDGCTAMCTSPTCGNGTVEGAEVCDDGNTDNTDDCTFMCLPATCGDGFLQAGVEDCDDGNTDDGDGCSKTCALELMCGDGTPMSDEVCLVPGQPIFVGQSPTAVAIGDLNADGLPDIVATSADASAVTVLFGAGDGLFAPAPPYPLAGTRPVDLTVVDLDGDGYDDIVTADQDTSSLSVLYGTGVPTPANALEPAQAYPGFSNITGIAAEDLDTEDPNIELVLAHDAGITLFSVADDASRGTPATSNLPLGAGLDLAVTTGDLTGEGITDVFVLDRVAGTVQAVQYLPATKTLSATLPAAQPLSMVSSGRQLAAADLNEDDTTDLLVGVWDAAACDYPTDPDACAQESFGLLFGDGAFSFAGNTPPFASEAARAAGKAPTLVLPALINGDTRPDLVVVNRFSDTLDLRIGAGDGTFSSALVLDTLGHEPVDAAAADLNADGITDIVSVETYTNSVSVFLSNP